MCTHVVKAYTNARFISKVAPVRFVNYFPCGFCSECIKQKRQEWRARAYYEAKRCFNDGGFVLFDTLTYSDENLRYFHDVYKPKLYQAIEKFKAAGFKVTAMYDFNRDFIREGYEFDSSIYMDAFDFLAFSREDVKKFFKRLRKRLFDNGYDVGDNLRYFITSEYGTSEETKGHRNTHRPHYHFLLYVNFPIDPIELSRYISESWTLGKTDGVRPYDDCSLCPVKAYCKGNCIYQSKDYVLRERVIRGSNANAIKACNYVSKYVSKNLSLYNDLLKRCFYSFSLQNPKWQETRSGRQEFRRFKSQVLPFHLQSQGLGVYAIQDIGKEKLLENNFLTIPTSDKNVVAKIGLPMYFKRKMLYTVRKIFGRYQWIPNSELVDYKLRFFERSVNTLSQKISAYLPETAKDGLSLKVARYHLLRQNVLVPDNCQSLSDDEINQLISSPEYYNYRVQLHYDLLLYNDGKLITSKYNNPDFVRQSGSKPIKLKDFFESPRYGFHRLKIPEYDKIIENFLSLLKSKGNLDNNKMMNQEYQRDRYIQLGMLLE